MENIVLGLEENLKSLYRKAVDADEKINALKKQGHGKFERVFNEQTVFDTQANKFMPYLEETAEKILKIKEGGDISSQQPALEQVVKQLHLLHKTLADFKAVLK